MRTLNKIFTIGAMAFLFMLLTEYKSMAQGYVSDQEFYDNLQNYGTWVQDDRYGNVWVPDVDDDFRPYATEGHWVQTDYGTTWVSDYPWGWATFHYGRWRYDDYYGWEWIPGHEWAPAWVTWRQGGGYYGWAPMQPGITISISFGGGYHVPDNYWVCAPQAYITSPYINRYYAASYRSVTIIHNTTYIHNTYITNNRTYIVGPRPRDIERVTHRNVTVYKIGNAEKPGAPQFNRNTVNFYRPVVKASPDARPARVVNAKAYRAANPHDGIGRPGTPVNVHANAAKLAAVARTNNPRIVHVNPAPERNEAAKQNKNNAAPVTTHAALPGGHRDIGIAHPAQQQPAAENKNPRRVAPAVMPPADHHDPTVRHAQPALEQQKHQAQEQVQQRQQQQQQKQDQQQVQQRQQQHQAAQQAKQQAQQQVQQRQQAARQAKQQAQQQVQQRQQQQQAAQQARQQVQQQVQQRQQQQQAAQQAKQQAQQQVQQRQQQQQAAQQARQQVQQRQQQQAQQRQQAAQKAAQQAAQKQQQQDQRKQSDPPEH